MKFKNLMTTVLISTVVLGGVSPLAANAAPDSLTGKGTVTYEEDNEKNPIIDPEDPEKEIDPTEPVVPNPDGGPITIDAVTNLDFGVQKIGVSPKPSEYKASAVTLTQNDGTEVTRGNFVQWTDKRAGNDHTYTINAQMTKQFTNGSNKLDGATITYSNPLMDSVMPEANWPTSPTGSFTLSETENDKKTAVDNSKSVGSQGLGTYSVEYGSSDLNKKNSKDEQASGLADDSVTLTVPAGLSIIEGKYEAEITWTIEYTP